MLSIRGAVLYDGKTAIERMRDVATGWENQSEQSLPSSYQTCHIIYTPRGIVGLDLDRCLETHLTNSIEELRQYLKNKNPSLRHFKTRIGYPSGALYENGEVYIQMCGW